MSSILNDFVATCPDTSDRARTCCKDPAVEDGIPAMSGKRWMSGVKGYDVGARAQLKESLRLYFRQVMGRS